MEVFIVQIKHSSGAVAACAAVIATLISASPAQATTKGISGLIAMQSTRGGGTQDFSMNPDGTAVGPPPQNTRLSPSHLPLFPGGAQVAFSSRCTGGGALPVSHKNT